MEIKRRILMAPFLAAVTLAATTLADRPAGADQPQPVGVATKVVGITVEEVAVIAHGWSTRKQLLGKAIFNDKGEKLGKIDDLIVSPEKSLTYAVVGVGGFLGIGTHDVAIPMNQLHIEHDRIVLNGATKEVVKAMPEFQYTK